MPFHRSDEFESFLAESTQALRRDVEQPRLADICRLAYGGKVRIHHCFNAPAAEKLRNTILEAFPNANVVIDIAHALCSFYAEQGGMLIGYEI